MANPADEDEGNGVLSRFNAQEVAPQVKYVYLSFLDYGLHFSKATTATNLFLPLALPSSCFAPLMTAQKDVEPQAAALVAEQPGAGGGRADPVRVPHRRLVLPHPHRLGARERRGGARHTVSHMSNDLCGREFV